jgi:hypothetical protein
MHVSGYRMGCDNGDPQGCVQEAMQAVAQNGIVRVFLSMPVDAEQTPADALVYSRLSVSHPFIAEAGFDDFVGRYGKLFTRAGFDPPSWLREVIRNVKRDNPHLAFGITLYEDELNSPIVRAPDLPSDIARSVDYVHFYLHYRTDGGRLSEYVAKAKSLFPDAKVIAGLYAYDRINYIPCSPSSQRECTPAEELRFYAQQLNMAIHLLKSGRVVGIEFYPGFFGKESEWGGWKKPNYCAQNRIESCITNTRAIREMTIRTLSATMGRK